MKSMVVQPFSSLFETPRIKLSREAFENSGIGIFSSEKIPFADRTGPAFAQNLTKLLVNRVENLQKKGQSFPNGIHVYELGAGTGILAKRILDLLKSEHKYIYEAIILHLSDISKLMIDQLKTLDAFKKHKNHVSFEVIDATKPKFTHKPLLVYFTNLIDSIPYHRQILIQDGQIFEFQIQTSIKEGAQIIDATSYPPQVLEEKEIAKLLLSPNSKRRLILAPQILTVLEEETKPVPISEVANIRKEELEDLNSLKAFLNKERPFTINYSYPIRMAIRKIIQGLEKGGFLFFSDFGIVSREHEQVLYIEFGPLIFFSVDFPALVQVAKILGKTSHLTSNAPGHAQEMLIDTLPNDKQIEELSQKLSAQALQGQVSAFLEDVKTILSKDGQITRLYNSLPEEVKIDYLLLNDLAFFLLQANLFKEASFYADILQKNFGHATGVYYYLVKGKVQQSLGDPKGAEEFFKTAIEGKKGFLAFSYLGDLYWQRKRYKEYIGIIKDYLKYTRKNDYLKSLFYIALAQKKLFGEKDAQKTLKALISLGQSLKNLSNLEKEFLKQAEQFAF